MAWCHVWILSGLVSCKTIALFCVFFSSLIITISSYSILGVCWTLCSTSSVSPPSSFAWNQTVSKLHESNWWWIVSVDSHKSNSVKGFVFFVGGTTLAFSEAAKPFLSFSLMESNNLKQMFDHKAYTLFNMSFLNELIKGGGQMWNTPLCLLRLFNNEHSWSGVFTSVSTFLCSE